MFSRVIDAFGHHTSVEYTPIISDLEDEFLQIGMNIGLGNLLAQQYRSLQEQIGIFHFHYAHTGKQAFVFEHSRDTKIVFWPEDKKKQKLMSAEVWLVNNAKEIEWKRITYEKHQRWQQRAKAISWKIMFAQSEVVAPELVGKEFIDKNSAAFIRKMVGLEYCSELPMTKVTGF